MAFDKTKLVKTSSHANSGEGQQFSYKEDATIAAISASAYMNAAVGTLQKGDIIVVYANNGTGLRQVTSNTDATPVTVGALTT